MNWIVAFALVVSLQCAAGQPGFKTTLTQNGLDYLRTVGIELLQQALSSLSIPDINGETDSPIGKIEYSLSGITLTNTNLGTSAVTIDAGTGLTLSMSGVGASAHMDWHYKMKDFPHTSDHGSADVAVSQTSASVTIVITDSNGAPYANCPSASVSVGHLDISLHGGASWLYNLFISSFSDSIKDAVSKALHDAIIQNVNTGLNKVFKTLPLSEPIDHHVEIDFPLVSNPVFGSGYFSLPTLGEFYIINAHSETPYPRVETPDVITSEMLQMVITEFSVVSAGYVYWKLGELTAKITQADIPSDVPVQLNTTFFKTVLPQLYNTFPNLAMQLELGATEMPNCTFSPTGAAFGVTGDIAVEVILPNGTAVPAFTLSGPVNLAGVALLDGTSIFGNLTYLSAEFVLASSEIGPFSVSTLDTLLNLLFDVGVVPAVNKILAKGFPLPTVTGLTFVNPTIGWGDHYLYVSTDVNYVPKIDEPVALRKPVLLA